MFVGTDLNLFALIDASMDVHCLKYGSKEIELSKKSQEHDVKKMKLGE